MNLDDLRDSVIIAEASKANTTLTTMERGDDKDKANDTMLFT